jgi:hypothetical protein
VPTKTGRIFAGMHQVISCRAFGARSELLFPPHVLILQTDNQQCLVDHDISNQLDNSHIEKKLIR